MPVNRYIGKAVLYYRHIKIKNKIKNTCVRVESPHYRHDFVFRFPNVIMALLHVHCFNFHETFYLHCKCSAFLGTRAHYNAIKRSIKSYFLNERNEEAFVKSAQL